MPSDKIYYSSNWMGPINKAWCDKNGSDWAGGRIDIRGDSLENPYGEEVGLPIMKSEDWLRFSDWLEGFYTVKEIYSLDEILDEYYAEGNPEITWFKYASFLVFPSCK